MIRLRVLSAYAIGYGICLPMAAVLIVAGDTVRGVASIVRHRRNLA